MCFYTGSVIILDGQLLWSDLDADTTFLLYEYARLVDMERLRSSLLALSGSNDASVSGVSGTTLGTIDYEKWMSAFERQSGFLTSSLDIMVGSGAGSANWNVGWVNASQLNERTSTHCLWSPLLYVINTMSVELSASEVTGTTQSDTLSDVPSSAAWSARSSGSRNQYSSAYKGFSMESQLSLGNTSALARVVCYRQGR